MEIKQLLSDIINDIEPAKILALNELGYSFEINGLTMTSRRLNV